MNNKKTLVIGASDNPARYSYLAIKKLVAHGHTVEAIGKRGGVVSNVNINTNNEPIKDLHTITLYINPQIQREYYGYILSLRPQRIIFNPGTENEELKKMAEQSGIKALEACTLVMLSAETY